MSSILHRFATALTLLVLGLPGSGQDRPAFRADVDTVPLFVTVADRAGRAVAGLTRNDFVVIDNGAPRPITVFSTPPQPITAVLMLDMGVSRDVALWLQSAGETFVSALAAGDRVRIGTFGRETAVSARLSGDKGYLLHVLRGELWPGQGSSLWPAFDEGMSSLATETGRRAVIVFTGGTSGDVGKRYVDDRSLAQRAEREGFALYAVAVRPWGADSRLTGLTERTGGRTVRIPSIAEAGDTFGAIVEELQTQYAMGFVPATLDGKTHEIEVVVNYKNLDVRARRSYLAAPAAR